MRKLKILYVPKTTHFRHFEHFKFQSSGLGLSKLSNRYFFCKSKCIPCRIASPLVILCSSQYFFNFRSVSLSRHTLNRLVFGSFTLGLPTVLIVFHPFLILITPLLYLYHTKKSTPKCKKIETI